MLAFIVRRLLYAPFLVLGVSLVTFIVFNVVGGNPVFTLAGKYATPRAIQDLSRELGFDRPLFMDLDCLWRRLERDKIRAAVEGLAIPPEVEALDHLFTGLDGGFRTLRQGGRLDEAQLQALEAEARALGLTPAPPPAPPRARLLALSGPCLARRTAIARERIRSRDAVYGHGRLAVPELVELATTAEDPRTVAAASRALAYAVYEDFILPASATPAQLEARQKGISAWWDAHREEFGFTFDAGATFGSLLHSQFSRYLVEVFTLDFGKSYKTKKPVWQLIGAGAPVSLCLAVPAFLAGTCISVAIALLCAFYQGRFVDRATVIASVAGMSVSILVFIILGQKLLAADLGLFPIHGYRPGLAGARYFILPGLIWIVASLGADVRFYRTVFVDETRQDYIRTARAKGLSNRAVMFKHLLRNTMVPVITRVVIVLPFLYTGSLLLERYFGLPGLGKETVDAVLSSDFPVIKALTLVGSLLYIVAILITDVLYVVVDPRVSLR